MTVTQLDRTARPGREWADLLSPREAEVLGLIAEGRSNAEIAEVLCIGVATVKTHVAQLLRKVRARDRVALVVAAYTSGFRTVPAPAPERRRCTSRERRRHLR